MKIFPCLIILLLTNYSICGQEMTDTLVTTAEEMAVASFHAQIGEHILLYNGSEYIPPDPSIKGSPFLETAQSKNSVILYQNQWYKNVALLYDAYRDEVVLLHPSKFSRIQLLSFAIDAFNLPPHSFRRLIKDSTAQGIPATGFYEILYDGKSKLYARQFKTIAESRSNGILTKSFSLKTSYYFVMGNHFYPIKKVQTILKMMPDQKKEIRKYLSENKINFRDNKEKALVKIVARYDELTSK